MPKILKRLDLRILFNFALRYIICPVAYCKHICVQFYI